MAKQKSKSNIQDPGNKKPAVVSPTNLPRLAGWPAYLIIFLFSFLLYANTLGNEFAVDDGVVYTNNRFTKMGFGGLKDQFTHDAFEGYFGENAAKLVSGGRYRPLSMVTFSLEYELLRRLGHDKRGAITEANGILGEGDTFLKPSFSHGINIFLFSITCLLLYHLLKKTLPDKFALNVLGTGIDIPFIATLLYAAHPLHVEAVANIKGRDEIMCMLFSLAALLAALQYVKSGRWQHLLWGALVFELALFSKENAVTFFAVIPLTFFFFTNARVKNYIITLGVYLIPFIIFLVLRNAYTKAAITQESAEILNTPFLLATTAEHYATVILTFLLYFKLLLVPHPLTTDYYYNQIPYVNFADIRVLLSIVINIGLLLYAFKNWSKKTIPVYAILFFYITFSISSNLLFTVGTLMNDRLVFMSSLGFCLLVAYLLVHYQKAMGFSKYAPVLVLFALLFLYSVKTIARNAEWKNNLVLFEKDIHNSPNSARMHKIYAAELTQKALSLEDTVARNILLDSSIDQANEALRIYPSHAQSWLVLGNALQGRGRYFEAITAMQKADEISLNYMYDAVYNLGKLYDQTNQTIKSKQALLRARELDTSKVQPCFLLALEYAKLNQVDSAHYWIDMSNKKMAMGAEDYYYIGNGFGKFGHNLEESVYYLNKAIELDPKNELYYTDLTVAYGVQGNFDKAIEVSEKLLKVKPNAASAYLNLAISYRNKKDNKMADEYQAKYNQIVAGGK